MTHAPCSRKREKRRRKYEISKTEKRSKKFKGTKLKSKSSRGAPSIRGKLCTNVCPVADLWMNCDELHDKWSGWLCKVRRRRSLSRLGTIPHFWFAEPDSMYTKVSFFWFITILRYDTTWGNCQILVRIPNQIGWILWFGKLNCVDTS